MADLCETMTNIDTDTIDMLAIIAGETGRLTPEDRGTIRSAASELDALRRDHTIVSGLLQATNEALFASQDRARELQSALDKAKAELHALRTPHNNPMKPISMSTGWVTVENRICDWVAPR